MVVCSYFDVSFPGHTVSTQPATLVGNSNVTSLMLQEALHIYINSFILKLVMVMSSVSTDSKFFLSFEDVKANEQYPLEVHF